MIQIYFIQHTITKKSEIKKNVDGSQKIIFENRQNKSNVFCYSANAKLLIKMS